MSEQSHRTRNEDWAGAMTGTTFRRRLTLLICSVVASLVVSELLLRRVACREAGVDEFELVRQRYLGNRLSLFPDRTVGRRDNALVPGDHANGKFHVNVFGARGAEIKREKPPGMVRVVCLGGSAVFGTENSSDATTWPARLQVCARHSGMAVEVINAGVPAFRSDESVARFEHHFLSLGPDVAVLYNLHNDVLERRIHRLTYDPRKIAPVRLDGPVDRLLSRSALYLRVRALFTRREKEVQLEAAVARLEDLSKQEREKQRRVTFRAAVSREQTEIAQGTLNDDENDTYIAERDLVDYETTLRHFVSVCRAANVTPVLATQAFAFALDGGPEEFVRRGGHVARYMPSHDHACAAFRAYNELVRRVARETDAVLFDADRLMSRAVRDWADVVHMSDEGCDRFARLLLRCLADAGTLASR